DKPGYPAVNLVEIQPLNLSNQTLPLCQVKVLPKRQEMALVVGLQPFSYIFQLICANHMSILSQEITILAYGRKFSRNSENSPNFG
ncbi:MAG: hypothetical protein ACYSTZ_13395, partial [Planctomycetota bacterium]